LNLHIGNLRSVANAVHHIGFDPEIVHAPEAVLEYERLVLPGVGSFEAAARKLSPFRSPVMAHVSRGRPLLGICIGLQLLSERSEEDGGENPGLGLIPGKVRRLAEGPDRPVPHVGWNEIEIASKHPILEGVRDGVDFYFTHSFALHCLNQHDVVCTTHYGEPFVSIAAHENVVGLQFHPEKSQQNGLRILENFCHWKP
jgi:glutamine amidotransferase